MCTDRIGSRFLAQTGGLLRNPPGRRPRTRPRRDRAPGGLDLGVVERVVERVVAGQSPDADPSRGAVPGSTGRAPAPGGCPGPGPSGRQVEGLRERIRVNTSQGDALGSGRLYACTYGTYSTFCTISTVPALRLTRTLRRDTRASRPHESLGGCPGPASGSPRGAVSGSTRRFGLWPVQVETAAKPNPGPRTSRSRIGDRRP